MKDFERDNGRLKTVYLCGYDRAIVRVRYDNRILDCTLIGFEIHYGYFACGKEYKFKRYIVDVSMYGYSGRCYNNGLLCFFENEISFE